MFNNLGIYNAPARLSFRRVVSLVFLFFAFVVALELGEQLSNMLYGYLCPSTSYECWISRPAVYSGFLVSGETLALALYALTGFMYRRTQAAPFTIRGGSGRADRDSRANTRENAFYRLLRRITLHGVPTLATRRSIWPLFCASLVFAIITLMVYTEFMARDMVVYWMTRSPDSGLALTLFLLAGFLAYFYFMLLVVHLGYGAVVCQHRGRGGTSHKGPPHVAIHRALRAACAILLIIVFAYVASVIINLVQSRGSTFDVGACVGVESCNSTFRLIELCVRSTGWILACEYTRRWWSRTEDA